MSPSFRSRPLGQIARFDGRFRRQLPLQTPDARDNLGDSGIAQQLLVHRAHRRVQRRQVGLGRQGDRSARLAESRGGFDIGQVLAQRPRRHSRCGFSDDLDKVLVEHGKGSMTDDDDVDLRVEDDVARGGRREREAAGLQETGLGSGHRCCPCRLAQLRGSECAGPSAERTQRVGHHTSSLKDLNGAALVVCRGAQGPVEAERMSQALRQEGQPVNAASVEIAEEDRGELGGNDLLDQAVTPH